MRFLMPRVSDVFLLYPILIFALMCAAKSGATPTRKHFAKP